jgi:hypothetical protein
MTSILKVDSIQNAAGTAAMTIDSNGLVIPKKVAFQAIATDIDQSYTATDYAKVLWESVELDTASYWDSTNNRYTPQVAGWYLFGGQVRGNFTNVLSFIGFNIAKNGFTNTSTALSSQFQHNSDTFSSGEYPLPTGIIQLNGSTDYVEVFFQADENCILSDSAGRKSFFWGMLVHPI